MDVFFIAFQHGSPRAPITCCCTGDAGGSAACPFLVGAQPLLTVRTSAAITLDGLGSAALFIFCILIVQSLS